jgi:hypothetical protein
MLNMDMIGRMKDSTLVVEGMGTSPHWEELAKKENLAAGRTPSPTNLPFWTDYAGQPFEWGDIVS